MVEKTDRTTTEPIETQSSDTRRRACAKPIQRHPIHGETGFATSFLVKPKNNELDFFLVEIYVLLPPTFQQGRDGGALRSYR